MSKKEYNLVTSNINIAQFTIAADVQGNVIKYDNRITLYNKRCKHTHVILKAKHGENTHIPFITVSINLGVSCL